MRFLGRKHRKPPTIIIVALIDVLMVVLIFLVVTTTFKQQPAVKLALPESKQSERESTQTDNLILTVAKEPPHFYLGDKPVKAAALEAELKNRLTANPDLKLAIRADTDAPFGQIIKVTDAAKLIPDFSICIAISSKLLK